MVTMSLAKKVREMKPGTVIVVALVLMMVLLTWGIVERNFAMALLAFPIPIALIWKALNEIDAAKPDGER